MNDKFLKSNIFLVFCLFILIALLFLSHQNGETYSAAGTLYFWFGNYEQAKVCYQEAILRNPQRADYYSKYEKALNKLEP